MVVLACHQVFVVWVDDHVADPPYLKKEQVKRKKSTCYHRLLSFHEVLVINEVIKMNGLLERIKTRHKHF